VCANLLNDPEHCGSCAKACAPGMACAGGVCQRVVCQGQPLLSGTAITSTPIFDFSFSGAVLVDVNGDGQLDLVILQVESTGPDGLTRKSRRSIFKVSLGQPGGRFASPQSYAIDGVIRRVQVADINHDGVDDLLFLKLGQPCLELWLGHSDGPPTPGPEIPGFDCGTSWAMVIADISGDGNLDLVASSVQLPGEGRTLDVYLSDGTGAFRYSRSYTTLGLALDLVFKDWNGDGFPDLVVVGESLQLLYNRGDGTFADAEDCGIALGGEVVVSDFNHDGHLDLAMGGSIMETSNSVDVLFGLGGCRFTPMTSHEVKSGCRDLKTADMDSDGQLDLLCMGNDMFTALLGNPDGSFQVTDPIRLVGTAGLDEILVGDVTGDGRPDIVAADRHGPVGVWENTCR
jgi:hypothetical protein